MRAPTRSRCHIPTGSSVAHLLGSDLRASSSLSDGGMARRPVAPTFGVSVSKSLPLHDPSPPASSTSKIVGLVSHKVIVQRRRSSTHGSPCYSSFLFIRTRNPNTQTQEEHPKSHPSKTRFVKLMAFPRRRKIPRNSELWYCVSSPSLSAAWRTVEFMAVAYYPLWNGQPDSARTTIVLGPSTFAGGRYIPVWSTHTISGNQNTQPNLKSFCLLTWKEKNQKTNQLWSGLVSPAKQAGQSHGPHQISGHRHPLLSEFIG